MYIQCNSLRIPDSHQTSCVKIADCQSANLAHGGADISRGNGLSVTSCTSWPEPHISGHTVAVLPSCLGIVISCLPSTVNVSRITH
ncbi:hypothetical protein GDO81_029057 [Engystomops pustulosus]|uniref:Uncharacterized protein n=1 Tax=Engystomops pustulosus TaxID=76066 RepID=A0AAV6ZID8_ENGPU|nr:hypothetical protein GDO81_029057 [Engystomops pustulosus]